MKPGAAIRVLLPSLQLLLQFGALVIAASRPPDVMSGGGSRPSQSTVVMANMGRAAKLPCPVSPVTFLEWSFGSQLLTSGSTVMSTSELFADVLYPRVDNTNSFLRILNVQRGHAGVYTCRVVTGFGTASHNVTLIVTDAQGSPFPDLNRSTPTPGNSITYSIVYPYLSNKTVSAGEQVTLECHVRGRVNIPGVMWYKEQAVDGGTEDKLFVDMSNPLPQALDSEYGVAGTWFHVRASFYSNTEVRSDQFTGKLTIRSATAQHAGQYLCSVAGSEQPLYRTAFLSVQSETGGGGPVSDEPATPLDGEPTGASSTMSSWLTTVFGSYSATLAVVIAVPCVVLLLVSAAVIYAVNKRKREHRAVKAKWRHQSKLGSAAPLESCGRPSAQARPGWSAGAGGGNANYPTDRGSGSSSSAPLIAQQQQQQSAAAGAALLGPLAVPRGDGLCSWPPAGSNPGALYYSDNGALGPTYQLQLQQQRLRPQDVDDDSSDSHRSAAMHAQQRPEYSAQNGVYCYYGKS